MHSKSASGWARIYVSYIRLHDMMPRTFPHPDGLVATTTGKQIARTGPGNAFAFGLMAFEDANAFPFAGRIFVIFVLSLTLPDTNIATPRTVLMCPVGMDVCREKRGGKSAA